MKLTPRFLMTFETNIQGISLKNWERVAQNLYWDKFMKLRPSEAKHEILTWLLDTGGLYVAGNGGNVRFDTLLAWQTEIENQHVNKGLELTTDEIEDNQMKDNPNVGVLDYAAKWASDTGFAAAYYPQSILFSLILNGTTMTGYDGVPFFSTAHPIQPGQSSGGTYSNLISGVDINPAPTTGQTELDAFIIAQQNFAKALAAVATQKFVGGVPRYLRPKFLLVPTALQYRAEQLTSGAILGQTSNVLTTRGLEVIVAPELDNDPTSYYIGVEDMLSDELSAFVYSERKPFAMRTYSPMEQVKLDERDTWEWLFKGRNGAAYGHPFLFYRCTV
jgi:phage major head subunit gpT-like protein